AACRARPGGRGPRLRGLPAARALRVQRRGRRAAARRRGTGRRARPARARAARAGL
ncbi:MAG: hypothetical protein AVDCRST_MAG13-2985, partial [uncultured Solirubrobacteraceae bacterium]